MPVPLPTRIPGGPPDAAFGVEEARGHFGVVPKHGDAFGADLRTRH